MAKASGFLPLFMKTTQVRITPETAEALREIAANYELFIKRGFGAGEGSTGALLDILVRAYEGPQREMLLAVLGEIIGIQGPMTSTNE